MLIRNSNLNLAIPTMNRGGYGLGIPREGLYSFLRYANYDTGSGIWYDDLDFKNIPHSAQSTHTGTGSAILTDSGSYGWKFTPADPWGQGYIQGRGQRLSLDTTDWSAPSGSTIIFTISPNWALQSYIGAGPFYCPCQETALHVGIDTPEYKVMALFDEPSTPQSNILTAVGESRIVLNDVLQNPTPLTPRPTLSTNYTRPGYNDNLQTVGASNIVVAQKSALTNSFSQFGSPRFTMRAASGFNPPCYRYYDGALRDVLIYNRQLSDAEIATITSLLAYYATQPENWTRHFG